MKRKIKKGLKKIGLKVEGIKDEKRVFLLEFPQYKEYKNLSVLIGSKQILKNFKNNYPNFLIETHKEGFLVTFSDLRVYVESAEEFFILNEVFIEKDYLFNSAEKYVLIDVGTNIGITSLFFSKHDSIEKIYAFEPVLQTYNQALYNFDLNENKVTQFKNIGLGSRERKEIFLFDNLVKGNSGVRGKLSKSYNKNLSAQEIEVKIHSASKEFKEIFDMNQSSRFVVKMDCEGAEYEIFDDLKNSKLIDKIDIFIVEWHDKGADTIISILNDFDFVSFSRYLAPNAGMIYAYKK